MNPIERVNQLVRTSRELLLELGHEPTDEELARRLGVPLETVRQLLAIARRPIALET